MVSLSKVLNGGLVIGGNYFDVASPDQAAIEQYNIINFLGGSAPYKQYPGYGVSTDIPPQCKIEQVQFFGRHGERFPTKGSGARFEKITEKLKSQNVNGSLSFIRDYEYFVPDKSLYDMETTEDNSNSIYIGSESARRDGVQFRLKYNSLFDKSKTLPLFTSNSRRCYDTSQNFARGFLGSDYAADKVYTSILDEDDEELAGGSLTPIRLCKNYDDSFEVKGLDRYFNPIIEKFKNDGNPNLNLTISELQNMFAMCAYEINVRGSSPFCELFTKDEFIAYEYYNDLDLYFNSGPGNNLTGVAGSVFVKASEKLLTSPPDHEGFNNKIFVSFTHDNNLVNYYTALGIFDDEPLPTDDIVFGNKFNKAKIIPQSTRIILEKYSCDDKEYVRYIINDSVVPLKCHNGPGFSCELNDYKQLISKTLQIDYNAQCGNNGTNEIQFYWDYPTVKYNVSLINS